MCTRYIAPDDAAIERAWHVGRSGPTRWPASQVFPRRPGPFIRAGDGRSEVVRGLWGLIPWFSKTSALTYSTSNARSEELALKASFKHPWARGQRCLIPAESFDEPNWESGKNVWWRFRRADGDAWGLAGLWNTWTDPASGEIVESYTMLTINADSHPLMRRMHKPDPKLPADQQDKRSVVPIKFADVDRWLTGTVQEASALLRMPEATLIDARPAPSVSPRG